MPPSSSGPMPMRPSPMGARPQMPPSAPPSMPSRGMEGPSSPNDNEKNAMMVGMAVLRGEIDLASLDPKIAEIVIQVLNKYHPGWQQMLNRNGPPPSGPGMPMGQRPPPSGPGMPGIKMPMRNGPNGPSNSNR